MKSLFFFLLAIGLLTTPLQAQDTNSNTFSRVSVKISYANDQHLEPQIYGQDVNTQTGDLYGGNLQGLQAMNGLNLQGHYFFTKNFGLATNLGFGISENYTSYENAGGPFVAYKSNGSYYKIAFGAAMRIQPENSPASLIIGSHLGYYNYDLSMSQTSNDNGIWYDGNYQTLKLAWNALLEFRIYKGLNIFTEIDYSMQPWSGDEFYVDYLGEAGEYASIAYNHPSMASIRLGIGLGYNF